MAEAIPAGLSRGEARRFGVVVGAAYLVLAGLLWWRARLLPAQVSAVLGAVLVLFGLVLPGVLSPVHRGWMAMAAAISKVTTPVFMGVVYFGVLTPIGLARRLLGHDALRHAHGEKSLWVTREGGGRKPADMEHQF